MIMLMLKAEHDDSQLSYQIKYRLTYSYACVWHLEAHLEAACAFEVVALKLGEAWGRLDGRLFRLLLLFFSLSWG